MRHRMNGTRAVLRCETGAQRTSSDKRLGDQNNVRLGGKLLIAEEAAGAAESALNLIGDQQSAVLRGEGTSAIPESFADGINPAFTLDRFQKNAADGVVEFRFEISDIVEANKFSARNKWCERQPVFLLGSDTDGAERAPMK